VTLNAAGAVTQSAPVTATSLAVTGAGGAIARDTNNNATTYINIVGQGVSGGSGGGGDGGTGGGRSGTEFFGGGGGGGGGSRTSNSTGSNGGAGGFPGGGGVGWP
jgi:hypothetical protein